MNTVWRTHFRHFTSYCTHGPGCLIRYAECELRYTDYSGVTHLDLSPASLDKFPHRMCPRFFYSYPHGAGWSQFKSVDRVTLWASCLCSDLLEGLRKLQRLQDVTLVDESPRIVEKARQRLRDALPGVRIHVPSFEDEWPWVEPREDDEEEEEESKREWREWSDADVEVDESDDEDW